MQDKVDRGCGMSVIDTLITNRTQTDVNRVIYLAGLDYDTQMTASEQAEWDSDLKGAYNASDMNRVGAAVQYIADLLATYGYTVTVTAKQDFAEPTNGDTTVEPTAAQAAAYIADLTAISAVLPNSYVIPVSLDALTYTGANAIESMLFWATDIIAHIRGIITGQFNAYSWAYNLYFGRDVRTWAELDALNTTWANWQVATWIDLLIGDMTETGVVT